MNGVRSAFLLLCLLSGAAHVAAAPPAPMYAFTNGRWWNGSGYESKTMYSVNGELRSKAPPRVHETIDLGNRFVIPPLAEGHNHWIEPTHVEAYTACYLADGVYYLKDMANLPWAVNQFRDRMNTTGGVDFTTALQGFTGPGGHPIEQLDLMVQMGILPKHLKPEYDPDAQFVVRTENDVEDRFKVLLPENPAQVKLFLLYSEEYEKRLKDPSKYGNSRGIDPRLVPGIVRRAHDAGLEVLAHVYSVPDFRVAVRAGADDIVHLPAAYEPDLPVENFKLTPADAKLARARGVRVTTTLYWVKDLPQEQPQYAEMIRNQFVIPNLRVLKEHGVPILVGSDQFRKTVVAEVLFLRDLGVFSNAELLRMATETTVRAIFPDRKLGRLADGYEADFLVLDKDPLVNLDHLRSIHLRVKQGRRLTVPAAAASRPGPDCVIE